MWRLTLTRWSHNVLDAGRPYHRVLQLLQAKGKGPRAVSAVFDEFRAFYRRTVSDMSRELPTSARPLQQFCGGIEDVGPFAVVMMKVLCDLRRFEDLRFLFAQCMLELPSPSVELFNIFLHAISLTDTFNQYEIENAVDLMREKCIDSDVVTRLSLFIMYTRLGQDYSVWWPSIREEILRVSKSGHNCAQKFPLLAVRLQHCFQTLLRIHHDTAMLQECFELLALVDAQRLSSRLLLPYMMLGTSNASTLPSTTVALLRMLTERHCPELVSSEGNGGVCDGLTGTSGGSSSCGTGASVRDACDGSVPSVKRKGPDLTTGKPKLEPALNNEVTALKLMAKCAAHGDVASATYVMQYLRDHPGVITPLNRTAFVLLHLESLVRAGLLRDALFLVEDELPESDCVPGPRPKLFYEPKGLMLLTADPVTSLVRLVAIGGVKIDEALSILEERRAVGCSVSHKTLNIVLEACVLLKDEARSSSVFTAYQGLDARPTARTFALLVSASPNVARSAKLLPSMFQEMKSMGVEPGPDFFRMGLELAIDAQDGSAAMFMVDHYERQRLCIESKLSARLFKMLSLLVDVEGVRRLIAVLRSTRSPIDSRWISLCVSTFKKWAIACDDLVELTNTAIQ
ncbi:hypothetical protein TRVL_05083 [Trypanosoma vivax]|nr:hypothetical protein TRVL_05083 [Trypanosoma vivax]